MTKGSGDDRSPVAPVDLSQAIIGPGMAVFSKYAAVLEADGSPMSVRTALQLINRFLAEDDFDATPSSACTGSSNMAGRRQVRRGRHAGPRQGNQRGRREASRRAPCRRRQRAPAQMGGVSRPIGTRKPTSALPVWEVLHQLIRVFNTTAKLVPAPCFAAVQSQSRSRSPACLPALYPLRTRRLGRRRPRLQRTDHLAGPASNPPPRRYPCPPNAHCLILEECQP